MVEKGCGDDREGGREGGRKGFQGAAGSRSTQTDAVERRWLEQKEQGKCVCVCLCAGGGGGGGQIVNTIPQLRLLLQQTIHAMIKSLRGVRGWVVIVGGSAFFLKGKVH